MGCFFMPSKLTQRPIGIFDSGIGGLTVASAIQQKLPNEKIVYFGDTAHLPYGEKSATSIRSFAHSISNFLVQKNCKALVIACNSASAVAAAIVKKSVPKGMPVINVIDPTAQYVADKYDAGKIGVIATKATVNSRIYAKRIERINEKLKVTMLATPLLVAMIEEGFFNNNISQAIINSYLEKSNLQDIEALILGCTHFPLVKSEIMKYYGNGTEVVDSSILVAEKLHQVLKTKGLLEEKKKKGHHHFYVSDYTQSFTESTAIFFGEKVKLEKKNLWA